MNRFVFFPTALCSLALFVGLTACAGGGDDSGTADDEIRRATGGVSGYDLQGPKVLPAAASGGFCPAVVSREKEACQRVGADSIRVGCRHLCSVPIAPEGKAAGYDFDGFKLLSNEQGPAQLCAAFFSPEHEACNAVNGALSLADGCKELCSKPIAPRGKTAGFDLRGFKVVASDRAESEVCAAVVSPVQAACSRVNGVTSPVNGCGHLCSLPL